MGTQKSYVIQLLKPRHGKTYYINFVTPERFSITNKPTGAEWFTYNEAVNRAHLLRRVHDLTSVKIVPAHHKKNPKEEVSKPFIDVYVIKAMYQGYPNYLGQSTSHEFDWSQVRSSPGVYKFPTKYAAARFLKDNFSKSFRFENITSISLEKL